MTVNKKQLVSFEDRYFGGHSNSLFRQVASLKLSVSPANNQRFRIVVGNIIRTLISIAIHQLTYDLPPKWVDVAQKQRHARKLSGLHVASDLLQVHLMHLPQILIPICDPQVEPNNFM